MKKRVLALSKFSIVSFAAGALFTLAVSHVGAGFKGSAIFRDIPADHYADEAIGEMYQLGIIKGLDSAHFGPDQPLTRGQAALLFQRLRNEIRGIPPGDTVSSSRSSSSSVSSSSSSSSSSSTSSSSSSTSSSSSSSSSYNPAGQLRFDSANYNVDENAATHQVTVLIVRIGGNQGTVTVNYAFSGGTAKAGTDYQPVSGTLTFGSRETSKKVTLQVNDNSLSDGNRTIKLKLSNPTTAGLTNPSEATINIIDNETAQTGGSSSFTSSSSSSAANVSFGASAYGAYENGTNATITVVRTGITSTAVAVNYVTNGGSAAAGAEYATTNGTLNFAAGETSKTFTIPVINNSTVDGSRTVNLALSNPTNGAVLLNPSTAVLTIMDDESTTSGTGSFKFSLSSYTGQRNLGSAAITVMHVGGIGAVSVTYATNGGTALPSSDYSAVTGTLSFAAGETSKVFFVPLNAGSTTSGGRTINLLLSSPTHGATLIEPSAATLTIGS